MKRCSLLTLTFLGVGLLATSSISARAAEVAVPLKYPCNLFSAASPVRLDAKLKGFPVGAGEAEVVLTNFFKEAQKKTLPAEVGGDQTLTLDLGAMEPGYYRVELELAVKGADGKEIRKKAEPVEIAVVNLVDRTAQQARKEKSRFGLKLFQIGPPGVWWRRPLVWDLRQAVDASAKMGLQWTRHSLTSVKSETTEPGLIGGLELVKKFPMNVIWKIEGMPEEAYDEQRYGSLADFKTNHPRKAKYNWGRTTVPKKAPYQAWLRQQLAMVPPDQDVFEIGNEVWTYMTGKEFAEWCQIVVPVVKEIRPNAVIGADPGEVSRPQFALEFFAARGMDGMNAVFVHPYTFAPEPETRTRQELRNQRDFLRQNTGREFDFYVTEYGWPTVPEKKPAQGSQSCH